MFGEILSIILFAALIIILVYHDRKARDRERHEWWLSDVRSCLRSIEYEFRRNCEKITEEELARRKFDEYKHSVRIGELKEKYIQEMTEKAIALKRVHITTIPEHLAKEYEENISDIADTFRYLGSLISVERSTNGIS
jgi:hypothetical protein